MGSVLHEIDVEDAFCAELAALGWQVAHAGRDPIDRDGHHEVILRPALREALTRINPEAPAAAIDAAMGVLGRDRSAMVTVNANQEFYGLLRDGVKVSVTGEKGAEEHHTVKVIDWDAAGENRFLVVRQLPVSSVTSTLYPDLVGFVNGLPLVLIELKGVNVPVREALDKNLTTYRHDIPQALIPNALVVLSNWLETRVGTLTATALDHFARWTRLDERAECSTDATTTLRAVMAPARLLDLVENFVLYEQSKTGLRKLVGQNHQVLGVNAAVARVAKYAEALAAGAGAKELEEARKLGVFWHTQGSGKSYSMAFLVRKVHRKVPGDWSFVVVTDRDDLDEQIHKNFLATGSAVGKKIRAPNARELKKLLQSNERVVFTLIQKFRLEEGQKAHPVVSTSPEMIVLADEAHRSQYAEFATNLRRALPAAAFMAFTGTPLIAGDETTVARFGGYVSRYPFFQAIEDGATVPLYYEATVPGMQLSRDDLDRALAEVSRRENLTAADQEQIEESFSDFYFLLNRSSRLDEVARNLVDHFLGFAPPMKGLVVCIDRPTTLRLYQRVEKALELRRHELDAHLDATAHLDDKARRENLRRKGELDALKTAVVLSRSQGDVNALAKQLRYRKDGLVAYAKAMADQRKLMQQGVAEAFRGDLPDEGATATEDEARRQWVERVLPRDVSTLAEAFKDPKNPLRLVFVCSMWITGFDAPACGVVYLDRPMANHTLMQTIARANRVFPGKEFGLVVDYVGVLGDLERAFKAYERELRGEVIDRPVADKARVLAELDARVKDAVACCGRVGVDLADLHGGDRKGRLGAISAAVEAFARAPDERRLFRALVGTIERLFRAVGEDPRRDAYKDDHDALRLIVGALTAVVDAPRDLSAVLGTLDEVLDEALDADEGRPVATVDRFDLGDLDLVALERLRNDPRAATRTAALGSFLQKVVRIEAAANPTLLGLQRRVEEALADYAQGAKDLASHFTDLVEVAATIKAHQTRTTAEGLTRTQLMDYDVALELLGEVGQRETVREGLKSALRALTARLPEVMGIDWRATDGGRSRVEVEVREAVEAALGGELSEDAVQSLRALLFKRVYERGG